MTDEQLIAATKLRNEVTVLEKQFEAILEAKEGGAEKIILQIDGYSVCEMLPIELLDVCARIGTKYEQEKAKFEAL